MKSRTQNLVGFWLQLYGLTAAFTLALVLISAFGGRGIATQSISYTRQSASRLGPGVFLLDIHRNLTAKVVRNKAIYRMGWSPDGTRLVYADDRKLSIMDVFRRQEHVLLSYKPSASFDVFSMDWSPDGQQIVIAALNDLALEIYRIDLDTPNWDHLLVASHNFYSAADFAQPVWSPDGQKIAFSSAEQAICVINWDGSGMRRLTESVGNNLTPTWAPDGQKILYASNENNHRNYELYLIGLDGSRKQFSTTAFKDFAPHWSPDGKYISFTAVPDGMYAAYIMNADGSDSRPLGITGNNVQWYS